jgi:endoglucanase
MLTFRGRTELDQKRGSMRSRFAVRAGCVAVTVAAAILAAAPAAWAGTANAGVKGASRSNPIAGIPWRPYEGSADSLWTAYAAARGHRRALLGRLALEPRALFIGSWIASSRIKSVAEEVVQGTQQGDPNALTQFGTFELSPWEGAWTGGGQWNVNDARRWYKGLAAGIGDARALVILQIDLPFAAGTPNQQPETIDAYGTEVLSADPHATVYIDAGAYGWLSPAQQGALLISNGIRHARGFSVNDTQYGSMSEELEYGAEVLSYLKRHGIAGKHFLVNTAQNGQPYLAGQVSVPSNDTPRCASRTQTLCQRTGIPPTTDVTNPRWHLTAGDAAIARSDVEGYVWASQPWNVNGGPFTLSFALNLGANGEY